jgi:oxygen-dependent protoporphyrinogen oxidase
VGGMRQPESARLEPDQLLARIGPDLRDLVGAEGPPVFMRRTFWPRAIPQYLPGYGRWLDQMTGLENRHSGLFIGGNARDGISVPDCIKSGHKLAGRTLEMLAKA